MLLFRLAIFSPSIPVVSELVPVFQLRFNSAPVLCRHSCTVRCFFSSSLSPSRFPSFRRVSNSLCITEVLFSIFVRPAVHYLFIAMVSLSTTTTVTHLLSSGRSAVVALCFISATTALFSTFLRCSSLCHRFRGSLVLSPQSSYLSFIAAAALQFFPHVVISL